MSEATNYSIERTAELHERITAILSREIDGVWEPAEVAGVLIGELGLRQERQHGPYSHLYRYTTEWSSDYE
jgi:hypothetical protein